MSPDGASVRPAAPADRPRLRAIQAAALSEPWAGLLDPATPVDPRLWVVGVDERVVGYAAALTAADPVAYLPEVAVVPASRNEGLGSRLLAAALSDLAAEGFERVRLVAPADDRRPLGFYERHGFEPVEWIPDRFEAGDGVVLARSLAADGSTPDGQG